MTCPRSIFYHQSHRMSVKYGLARKVIALGFAKLTRYMLVGSHVTRLTPLEWPSSFSTIVLSSASITLMDNSLLSISASKLKMTRWNTLRCNGYPLSLGIYWDGAYPDPICICNKSVQLAFMFDVSPDQIVTCREPEVMLGHGKDTIRRSIISEIYGGR